MKKDLYTLATEKWTQCSLIDDLKERITTLEQEVLQLQRKQTNESSYLGKRTPEVESCDVFETQANHHQKGKTDTDLLSERIFSLTMK